MSNGVGGAFQMSRQIFDSPIWQDVIKFRLFFFIVGNAVFSDSGVRIGNITLQRGQYLRSYRNLSSDLEYLDNRSIKKHSISVIKKKIDQLVEENSLIVEETELGTLFTVVNYAQYQGFEHYKNTTKNSERTEREHPENGARTEREQNENNNKKVKKDMNVKKDIKDNVADASSIASDTYENRFEEWWNLYSNKKDRKKCIAKYKLLLKKYSHEQMITGTKKYLEHREMLVERNEFLPQQKNPLTFLNGENFNDEYEMPGSLGAQTIVLNHPEGFDW